jgi:lycopene beta-cyclase
MNDRRVLVEDTRFSDNPRLERFDCLNLVQSYLTDRACKRFEIVREEHGCLPMPISGGMRPQLTEPLRGGYAGGWFHAATGYSFPLAVRFADAVASNPPHEASQRILQLARQNQFQAGFSRFLNRLLFRAVRPEQRWQIFRRFYRALPDAAIERFYGHQFNRMDAARMIFGAPPQGLTPFRFFNSFNSLEANPCLATQS